MDTFKDLETVLDKYGQKLIDYLPNIAMALVLLIVGFWIIRIINRFVKKFFLKKDYDLTLEKFIESLINWGLKIVLAVLVITQLGVESASLVAIIGAAGLAVGLALQGSLANFAGGVLILLLKPFKVGDFIAAQGVEGTVKEISIFNTRLNTFGNQLAILPNGKLSNENIINYTEESLRKENLTFGISYDCDIKLAKDILLNLVNEQEAILQIEGKMPQIVVTALADSSVNISVRYWADIADFWNLRFLILEEAKIRLEAAGIVIPFPQRDVHLYSENNSAPKKEN
jgi:small conductance mechanosensitive channel